MRIELTSNQINSNLLNNPPENAEKIARDFTAKASERSDTTDISPESRALANNEILYNLHAGLTLERVKFLLTPRV